MTGLEVRGHGTGLWPERFTTRPGADPSSSLRLLDALCRQVWSAVRLLAAGTLDVPAFECKLASGEAVFTLTEVAATLEERIRELGGQPDRAPGPGGSARLAATLALPPAERLPTLVHQWWGPLLQAFSEAAFDPLLDGPSERVRRRGLLDLEDAAAWFYAAYGGYPSAPLPIDEHADAGNDTGVGVSAAAPVVGTPPKTPLRRPAIGARDARFLLFEHTRDYRKANDWESSGSSYQDDLIELLRVNRDEIDALETFCLALFDLADEAPVAVLRHLARLAWDEARHAAAGHALIAELGQDPFRYECSMIGIKVRGAMLGWDAWTQITLFGELGIIGPMRRLEREARARGDERTAAAFGFICRDETMHLKESRALLESHHPAGGLAAAGEAARRRAGALLQEFGLFRDEQYAALDGHQIFALLGE